MALDYVFVIAEPYTYNQVRSQTLALQSRNYDYLFADDLGAWQRMAGVDNNTKVLFFGNPALLPGGIAAMVRHLRSKSVGMNYNAGQPDLYKGPIYFKHAPPASVDQIKALNTEGPVILHDALAPDGDVNSESLADEFSWLVTAEASAAKEKNKGVQSAVSILEAAEIMPGRLTVIERGLKPLELIGQGTLQETIKTVQTYLDSQPTNVAAPSSWLANLSMAVQRLQEPKVAASLFEGIDYGLDSLRAFIKSIPAEQAKAALNTEEKGQSPLSYAASKGNLEIVKELLGLGADLIPRSDKISRALVAGIANGKADVVDYFLKRSDLVDFEELMTHLDPSGLLPIALAAEKSPEILKMILQRSPTAWGTLDEKSGAKGYTALMAAVKAGNLNSVVQLLDVGARVDIADDAGFNILSIAVQSDPYLVRSLLRYGSIAKIIGAKNSQGDTILHSAVKAGSAEVLGILAQARPDLLFVENSNGDIPLFQAVRLGKREKVNTLLSSESSLAQVHWARKDNGMTALHEAAAKNWLSSQEMMKSLIAAGASLDVVGSDGLTPLMITVAQGFEEGFNLLMDNRANVFYVNPRSGKSVLDMAVDMYELTFSEWRSSMILKLLAKEAMHPDSDEAIFSKEQVFGWENVDFFPTRARATVIEKKVKFLGSAVVRGGVTIKEGSEIGNGADIGARATIGNNVKLGEKVKIGFGVVVHGGTEIGANVYVAGGIEFNKKVEKIPPDTWIDTFGIFDRTSDGQKGKIKNIEGVRAYANSKYYKKLVKLVAAADPIAVPGSSLRDKDDDWSGAGTGSVVADVPSEGEVEGEAIDRNARLKDAGAAKELWKEFLIHVYSKAAAPGELGRIAKALDEAYLREGVDSEERVHLVRELKHDVVDPLEALVNEAVAIVQGRGQDVTLDSVSDELGKKSPYDAFGGDAADPKSEQLRRKRATAFEQIIGNDGVAVIVGRHLVAGASEAGLKALGQSGEGARSKFNKLWLDRTDGNRSGLNDAGLKNAQWMQAELLLKKYEQQKPELPPGTTFDQYVDEQLPNEEAADLKEVSTEAFGVTAGQLVLDREAQAEQANKLAKAMQQQRNNLGGGPPGGDPDRSFAQINRSADRPNTAARLEAMGHYGSAIGIDVLFVILGSWGIASTVQARDRARAQGLDTRELDASLARQVAVTGTMGAMLAGRVIEAVGTAFGERILTELTQAALHDGGDIFTAAMLAQQFTEAVDAGMRYVRNQNDGIGNQQDKWAFGGAVVNFAVTAASSLIARIPVVGPAAAAAVQLVLPNWDAIGHAQDLQAQGQALRAQGLHHEADYLFTMAGAARQQGLPIIGQLQSRWVDAFAATVFAPAGGSRHSAEASQLLGQLASGALQVPQGTQASADDDNVSGPGMGLVDAAGALQAATADYVILSPGMASFPAVLRELINTLGGTLILPLRRDLAANPDDWNELVRVSARAQQERLDAQVTGRQDWFHQAFGERVQAIIVHDGAVGDARVDDPLEPLRKRLLGDPALVIDGGAGHDSVLVRQRRGVRINVDAGHDLIELDARVQQLELSLGLFPVAGAQPPKASVYAQASAAQLRLDIAGGELDAYLGTGEVDIRLYSAQVKLHLHDNAARSGALTVHYKPGQSVTLPPPELLAELIELQGQSGAGPISVRYTDIEGAEQSVDLRQWLGQAPGADADRLRIGAQPHQLSVWQGVPTRLALDSLIGGADSAEQAQAQARARQARIGELSVQFQALAASVEQLRALQLDLQNRHDSGGWSQAIDAAQLATWTQQGAGVGQVQSAWDRAFGEHLAHERAAFTDQAIYNPYSGKLSATSESIALWIERLAAYGQSHPEVDLSAQWHQLNAIYQRMHSFGPASHTPGLSMGTPGTSPGARFDLDQDNAVSVGLLHVLASIGIFQGQILTAAHVDEQGELQLEGSWLQQAAVLGESGLPELRLAGSAIEAVYFGEALLDPSDGAWHADAHTLGLWKSALLEQLAQAQGELDRLSWTAAPT